MPSEHFKHLLLECLTIHEKKNSDYAQQDAPFSNFDRAAELVSYFNEPIDQTFACLIGVKIARLAELRNGKEPKNESIRDTHIDLANYCLLWAAYYDDKAQGPIPDAIYKALNKDRTGPRK